MRWTWVTAAILVCAAAASAEVRFTEPPTAATEGGATTVRFAVSAATDVEVSVLDAKGRVVRHLAAGLLGANPPAPLQKNSLTQGLAWNRTDDDGKPAAGGPFTVRVRLGLGAKLDRFIGPANGTSGEIAALGCGARGEVFVLANRDKAGGSSIFVLDRDGKYLRTILPTPANVPDDKLKGLPRVKLADGTSVPLVYQAYLPDFAPYLSGVRDQQLAVSADGRICFASGGGDWSDQCVPRYVLCLNADGSTPADVGFVGPQIGPYGRYAIGLPRQQVALSPDGATVYIVGMNLGATKAKPAGQNHAVGRMAWNAKEPTAFIGDPQTPGDDATHLNNPVGLALDAKGNLYVADAGNNRVAAFDAAGKFLGQTKVERPRMVAVDPAGGALYVLTEPASPTPGRWGPFSLIKFDKPVGGREAARLDLNGRSAVFALDASGRRPRLWLSYDSGWQRAAPLLPIDDEGQKLVAGQDVLKAAAPFNSPLFAAVDGPRGRLYVGDFSRSIRVVDLKTDKVSDFLQASEVALDRDGNLYVLSGYGTDALLRLTPDGKPLAFAATGSNKIELKYRAGLPHVGVRGLAVGRDGRIYAFQDNNDKPMNLFVFKADGSFEKNLIQDIPPDSANSVAVDRAGNVYVGINVHDPAHPYPDAFAGIVPPLAWINIYGPQSSWFAAPHHGMPELPWSRMYLNFYLYHYGSVFKFSPAGGRFWIDGAPKAAGANPRPEGVPADAVETQTAYFRNVVWHTPALWQYKGFALSANRTESWGDPACSCMTSRFAMDAHQRLFVPDVFRFSVGVLDTNGNQITRFGAYGNFDSAGPGSAIPTPAIPLASPNAVTVAGDVAYVLDRKCRRVAVVDLTHAAEASCSVR